VMIAEEAARLFRPGQVVILDAGTTALEVARRLPLELDGTVVTNNPPAAIALAGHAGLDLILVGGSLYKESLAVVGAPAIEALRGIRADLCVLGVAGLHPEIGISVLNPEEPHVKRAMIDGAAEVVAVAAAEKLGTAAPYLIGPVNLLTHIVTDPSATEEQLRPYRDLGLTVIVASPWSR